MLDVPQYEMVMSSCRLFWLHLICFSYLVVLGSCQLQSSTMKLVSNSSEPVCAADRATTVSQARSLIDCQRQCSTQKSKCYASNFYSDTKACELYNFRPTTFTSSIQMCQMFANYDTSADLNPQAVCSYPFTIDGVVYNSCSPDFKCLTVNRTATKSCSIGVLNVVLNDTVSIGGLSASIQSIFGWIIWMWKTGDTIAWNLPWSSYRNGFGSFAGSNFWLGLERVYQLTSSSKYRLRIELNVSSTWYSVEYWSFRVGDEISTKYQLNLDGFSGDTANGMMYDSQPMCTSNLFPNGMKFSTTDADNDLWSNSCANQRGSGWWFSSCGKSCLTCSQSYFWWLKVSSNCDVSTLVEARMMMKLQ